ncbi:MAG: iron ABC transporter permease [Bacteroidota bacterium]
MTKRQLYILLILGGILGVVALWAAGSGAVSIRWNDILLSIQGKLGLGESEPDRMTGILWVIRLPRVCMALLAGAALGLGGAAMQGLFRNPLADPSIIGISGGAALAAASVIVIAGPIMERVYAQTGLPLLPFASFLGAMVATILIFTLSQHQGQTQVATMLLAGIAINALAASGTGILTYLADDAQLRNMTFWTMGSVGGADWSKVIWLAISLGLGIVVLLPLSKSLDALSLGETEAYYLGIPVESLKWRVVLVTGFMIGCAVAFCGLIGFIGLVAPHLMRLLSGVNHRYLLPAAALSGAIILVVADTLARTLVVPAEIPVGILTSLLGAPFFLFLLLRQRKAVTL